MRNVNNAPIINSIVEEFRTRLNHEGFGSALEMYKRRRDEVDTIEDRVFILAKEIEEALAQWQEEQARNRVERVGEVAGEATNIDDALEVTVLDDETAEIAYCNMVIGYAVKVLDSQDWKGRLAGVAAGYCEAGSLEHVALEVYTLYRAR